MMPQETKSDQGLLHEQQRATLEGWSVETRDESVALDALEKAFDYRGDVTLTVADPSGAEADVTGYIFDRRRGATLAESTVRLMTASSDTPVNVPFDRIRRLSFSGRDAAHGKSFETWVKRYVEKKLAGEKASIESETIE